MDETKNLIWIVSYGANLDPYLRRRRVGDVAAEVPGVILGHRLVFEKMSYKDPSVLYANIVEAPEAECPAVAMQFTLEQVGQMDLYEGSPVHYCHQKVDFRSTTGEGSTSGIAWVANPEWISNEGRVTAEYLDRIRRGYAHYGLPLEKLQEALVR